MSFSTSSCFAICLEPLALYLFVLGSFYLGRFLGRICVYIYTMYDMYIYIHILAQLSLCGSAQH